MYKNSTIVGIPLNYSSFSSSKCLASCETSLAFYLHPKKDTENLWGWSAKSLIGGGHNFKTSMRRSSQDNFCGKNSLKTIKYSQSYDVVCHLALSGGKGLRKSVCQLTGSSVSGLYILNVPRSKPLHQSIV